MLPQHLAYVIRDLGHEATHTALEALEAADDGTVWHWAAERNAIIISKDQDFSNRLVEGRPPRLIWIRWGNTRKQDLTRRFTTLWPEIIAALNAGEWMIELADAA